MQPGSNTLQLIENNFTKGLITEYTGMNFPDNAATQAENVEFTLIGDVLRREGIDYEENFNIWQVDRTGQAVNSYKWNNAGGDGETQLVVTQIGGYLQFWVSSDATTADPLSNQLIASNIQLSSFVAAGTSFDTSAECQFTDGNGYLFVFHPSCDPFYVTYLPGSLSVSGTAIQVQIRDFTGLPEAVPVTFRPTSLSTEHAYNLANQGWTTSSAWSAQSTTGGDGSTGTRTWTVATSITGISAGQNVYIQGNLGGTALYAYMQGTVTSYNSGTGVLNINVSTSNTNVPPGTTFLNHWAFTPTNTGYVNSWFSTEGNYPSNSDVWWYFKNSSDAFDPTTQANVSLATGNAPQGHFVLNAFNQNRSLISGLPGITPVVTAKRPRTGTWFQGRVWYTGVDDVQAITGDTGSYSWTENIYFSQIVKTPSDFGSCYQENDPTSENLFDLLPTDGGVIVIQGSGPIYKLFPIQNALLVFAANGIWYITGDQGIGFSANNFSQPKLSAVRSISGTSIVDINGLPMFWNEEGIYSIEQASQQNQMGSPMRQNQMQVNPVTVGTILSFYNQIPIQSKLYARASYDPINYTVQWIYRSTVESSVTDRYAFDSILNFNTYNKAFYPYTIGSSNPTINSILYVSSPGGTAAPEPTFKYLTSTLDGTPAITFSEERDDTFVDWISDNGVGVLYESSFTTGYKLQGQAQRRFQIPYLYLYSRLGQPVSYYIQAIWDFANTGNSGRRSTPQLTNIFNPNFDMMAKRHRLRGRGLALQFKVTSYPRAAFDIIGWSGYEIQNLGI